jgi:putative molybdopterin biosynthesis protein
MVHLSIECKFTDQPTRNRLEHPLLAVLESVHETGSIGKAAKSMGRSYRFVWGELKYWESELNADLIIWGRNHTGAELTPQAVQFLSDVSKTHVDLERHVARIKDRVEQCVCALKSASNATH